MTKRRYLALRPLYYPTDRAAVRRVLAGEIVPWAERGMVAAPAGAVLDDLPRESIPTLLAKGWIAEAGDAERKETT